MYKKSRRSEALKLVTKDSRICSVCGKSITNTSRLREHIIQQHMGGKEEYTCGICGKKFGAQGSFTQHVKTHQKQQHPHSCKLCDLSFPSLAKYNEHNKLRHATDAKGKALVYKCQHCKHVFTMKKNLVAHEERCPKQPRGAPRYQCFFCEQTFAQISTRNRHCKKEHPGQEFDKKDHTALFRTVTD